MNTQKSLHIKNGLAMGLISIICSGCSFLVQPNIHPSAQYPYDSTQFEDNHVASALRIANLRISQLNHMGAAECIPARLYSMQQLSSKIRGEHETGLNQDALLNLRLLEESIRNAEDGLSYLQMNTGCQLHVEDPRLVALRPLLNNIAQHTFAIGSAELPENLFLRLDELAHWLKAHPAYQVTLTGHTDSQGETKDNDKLALARSTTLANYLRVKQVPNYQVNTNAQGEFNPINSNVSESMRYRNRRVEVEAMLLIPNQKRQSTVKEWPSVTDIWGGK